MPQSTERRLGDKAQEALDYAHVWGRGKTMDKFGIKSTIAWSNFAEKKTGDRNFGLFPILDGRNGGHWAEELLDAFENKIHKMEAEYTYLAEKFHQVCLELEYYKGQQALQLEPKIQEVLTLCKV